MTDVALIAMLAAVPGTLAALTGLLQVGLSVYHDIKSERRSERLNDNLKETKDTVTDLKVQTNDRMDQLLESKGREKFQEGGDAARADQARLDHGVVE